MQEEDFIADPATLRRLTSLNSAMVIGMAGADRPSEPAGVAHLLAAATTRAELEALLEFVRYTNGIALANRNEANGPSSTNEIIFDMETQIVLTKNEEIVSRAIEIMAELDEYR